MNIIALDVGKSGTSVGILLSFLPDNLPKFFAQNRDGFFKVSPNKEGVNYLLSLHPDALVMEPTGGWYTAFWYRFSKVYSIPIYWIGHADLKAQRGHFGFKNKRDDEDALCLAASVFDPHFTDQFGRQRFLHHYRLELIEPIRELFFEWEQLEKLNTMVITQLKQRLSYEFPEISSRSITTNGRAYPAFLGYLAGRETYTRIEKERADSIAEALGIDLTAYTQSHAELSCSLFERIAEIQSQLIDLLDNAEFKPYLDVFNKYGFGLTLKTLLLLRCYPMERFLIEGEPVIEWEKSPRGWQKRERSLRWFQSYLGLSKQIEQSGDSYQLNFGGSKIMRSHLYVWALCRIAPLKNRLPYMKEVGNKWDDLREYKVSGKDAMIRVLYQTTRHLFRDLCLIVPPKKT